MLIKMTWIANFEKIKKVNEIPDETWNKQINFY